MGIKIIHIAKEKEVKESSSLENILKKEISFGSKFSNKKKEQFYSELSVLLKSGVNLKYGLDIIIESQEKQKDRELLVKLSSSILRGSSFADALSDEKSFSAYEYHAVKIGEQTGQLAFVTQDLAEYYKRRNEQKRQIISSLTYPVIVLFTAFLVVFFMLKYVVPMFEDIFQQNRVELPFLTSLIVKFSHIMEQYGFLFLIICALMVGSIRMFRKKPLFKKYSGELLLKLPVIGGYVRKVYLTRFLHTMMLLTNSKIPVINGLSMVREMVDFYPLQNSLCQIENDILIGEKLSVSFSKHQIFDKKIIALLKVAEETNQTEFIFQRLYDQYSNEVEYQSKTITNILNPLLTLMVGFIVGVILIAMYLPMFKLSSVIG